MDYKLMINITKQMMCFRESILLLIPKFEEENIPWDDENRYHDIDDIFEKLFKCFILDYLEEQFDSLSPIHYTYGLQPYKSKDGSCFIVFEDNVELGIFEEFSFSYEVDTSCRILKNNNSYSHKLNSKTEIHFRRQ